MNRGPSSALPSQIARYGPVLEAKYAKVKWTSLCPMVSADLGRRQTRSNSSILRRACRLSTRAYLTSWKQAMDTWKKISQHLSSFRRTEEAYTIRSTKRWATSTISVALLSWIPHYLRLAREIANSSKLISCRKEANFGLISTPWTRSIPWARKKRELALNYACITRPRERYLNSVMWRSVTYRVVRKAYRCKRVSLSLKSLVLL